MKQVKLFEQFIEERAKPPKLTAKQRDANSVKGEVTKELLGTESPLRPQINKIFKVIQKAIKQKASEAGVPLTNINLDSLTIKRFESFINEERPEWHDSDAPDAEGRFRDLNPKELAKWLIKTRKEDLTKITGSLNQQIVFNRGEDKEYADKMEKTRIEVYKQLGREDLLEAISVNSIECINCEWTWKLEDGGKDLYTCHECGHDNTPVLGESVNEAEETYKDYPAAAKANAKKAIKWRDEHGRDEVTGGTAVGWARANQLAKGESLSRDVVSRMAQFNRHRKNSKIASEYKDTPWKDRGYIAWLIWGGDAGVDWAISKMKDLDK